MLERFIQALSVADAGGEEPAATRERLKERFPRGATRRMTQLGLLVGAALDELGPRPDDAVVYASAFGESRALEGYLESFPTASPTLFQTSIHPSAVQQALIGRQHAVNEFFPLTGREHLPAHAVQAALLSAAPRVLLCGGEERGTWLLERACASGRSFAFALALGNEAAGAIGRVALEAAPSSGGPGSGGNGEPGEFGRGVKPLPQSPAQAFTLEEFFEALRERRVLDLVAAPGLRLKLEWAGA